MDNIWYARNIYLYKNNNVDENKAQKLDCKSVVRCFRFMLTETNLYDKIFAPARCFRCRIKNLLEEILIERNKQRYLLVINVSSFNDFDDLVYLKSYY